MTTTVGRLRPCGVLDWKFTVLSHNTIRGAAGAALLNAELLKAGCGRAYIPGMYAESSRAPDGALPRESSSAPMIVMKFGGTSVEDAKAIDRAAAIVKGRLRAKAGGRGQRHGQGDRPAAGHGAGRRSRRPRDRSQTLPRAAGAPLQHRRRTAGTGALHPVSTATWAPTSKRWTNCCAASRPSAN